MLYEVITFPGPISLATFQVRPAQFAVEFSAVAKSRLQFEQLRRAIVITDMAEPERKQLYPPRRELRRAARELRTKLGVPLQPGQQLKSGQFSVPVGQAQAVITPTS